MELISLKCCYSSTKLHSVMSQNTIILILLRLLEPRIYSGGLFVQGMNIRKINRFCMLSGPIFIRDFQTVCLIVIKYNIASQVMNKTVKCVFLMIVTWQPWSASHTNIRHFRILNLCKYFVLKIVQILMRSFYSELKFVLQQLQSLDLFYDF